MPAPVSTKTTIVIEIENLNPGIFPTRDQAIKDLSPGVLIDFRQIGGNEAVFLTAEVISTTTEKL